MALRERSKSDTDLTEAMFMDAPVTRSDLEKEINKVDGWIKENEQATASRFDEVDKALAAHDARFDGIERLLMIMARKLGIPQEAIDEALAGD